MNTKWEQACNDLRLKGERQRAEKAKKDRAEQEAAMKEEMSRPMKERLEFMKNQEVYGSNDEDRAAGEEHDALLDDDAELDKLRLARVAQLKKQKDEFLANRAKGHGEYIEVLECDFLKECLKSRFTVVHFFSDDFERCKIMDMHLKSLAGKHVETKFFKINATKTPFFVEKLSIQTLPTLVFFIDGKAMDRLVGFQGFEGGDSFNTRELEERIGLTGVIKMEREFYEDPEDKEEKKKKTVSKIFAFDRQVEDFDDDFY